MSSIRGTPTLSTLSHNDKRLSTTTTAKSTQYSPTIPQQLPPRPPSTLFKLELRDPSLDNVFISPDLIPLVSDIVDTSTLILTDIKNDPISLLRELDAFCKDCYDIDSIISLPTLSLCGVLYNTMASTRTVFEAYVLKASLTNHEDLYLSIKRISGPIDDFWDVFNDIHANFAPIDEVRQSNDGIGGFEGYKSNVDHNGITTACHYYRPSIIPSSAFLVLDNNDKNNTPYYGGEGNQTDLNGGGGHDNQPFPVYGVIVPPLTPSNNSLNSNTTSPYRFNDSMTPRNDHNVDTTVVGGNDNSTQKDFTTALLQQSSTLAPLPSKDLFQQHQRGHRHDANDIHEGIDYNAPQYQQRQPGEPQIVFPKKKTTNPNIDPNVLLLRSINNNHHNHNHYRDSMMSYNRESVQRSSGHLPLTYRSSLISSHAPTTLAPTARTGISDERESYARYSAYTQDTGSFNDFRSSLNSARSTHISNIHHNPVHRNHEVMVVPHINISGNDHDGERRGNDGNTTGDNTTETSSSGPQTPKRSTMNMDAIYRNNDMSNGNNNANNGDQMNQFQRQIPRIFHTPQTQKGLTTFIHKHDDDINARYVHQTNQVALKNELAHISVDKLLHPTQPQLMTQQQSQKRVQQQRRASQVFFPREQPPLLSRDADSGNTNPFGDHAVSTRQTMMMGYHSSASHSHQPSPVASNSASSLSQQQSSEASSNNNGDGNNSIFGNLPTDRKMNVNTMNTIDFSLVDEEMYTPREPPCHPMNSARFDNMHQFDTNTTPNTHIDNNNNDVKKSSLFPQPEQQPHEPFTPTTIFPNGSNHIRNTTNYILSRSASPYNLIEKDNDKHKEALSRLNIPQSYINSLPSSQNPQQQPPQRNNNNNDVPRIGYNPSATFDWAIGSIIDQLRMVEEVFRPQFASLSPNEKSVLQIGGQVDTHQHSSSSSQSQQDNNNNKKPQTQNTDFFTSSQTHQTPNTALFGPFEGSNSPTQGLIPTYVVKMLIQAFDLLSSKFLEQFQIDTAIKSRQIQFLLSKINTNLNFLILNQSIPLRISLLTLYGKLVQSRTTISLIQTTILNPFWFLKALVDIANPSEPLYTPASEPEDEFTPLFKTLTKGTHDIVGSNLFDKMSQDTQYTVRLLRAPLRPSNTGFAGRSGNDNGNNNDKINDNDDVEVAEGQAKGIVETPQLLPTSASILSAPFSIPFTPSGGSLTLIVQGDEGDGESHNTQTTSITSLTRLRSTSLGFGTSGPSTPTQIELQNGSLTENNSVDNGNINSINTGINMPSPLLSHSPAGSTVGALNNTIQPISQPTVNSGKKSRSNGPTTLTSTTSTTPTTPTTATTSTTIGSQNDLWSQDHKDLDQAIDSQVQSTHDSTSHGTSVTSSPSSSTIDLSTKKSTQHKNDDHDDDEKIVHEILHTISKIVLDEDLPNLTKGNDYKQDISASANAITKLEQREILRLLIEIYYRIIPWYRSHLIECHHSVMVGKLTAKRQLMEGITKNNINNLNIVNNTKNPSALFNTGPPSQQQSYLAPLNINNTNNNNNNNSNLNIKTPTNKIDLNNLPTPKNNITSSQNSGQIIMNSYNSSSSTSSTNNISNGRSPAGNKFIFNFANPPPSHSISSLLNSPKTTSENQGQDNEKLLGIQLGVVKKDNNDTNNENNNSVEKCDNDDNDKGEEEEEEEEQPVLRPLSDFKLVQPSTPTSAPATQSSGGFLSRFGASRNNNNTSSQPSTSQVHTPTSRDSHNTNNDYNSSTFTSSTGNVFAPEMTKKPSLFSRIVSSFASVKPQGEECSTPKHRNTTTINSNHNIQSNQVDNNGSNTNQYGHLMPFQQTTGSRQDTKNPQQSNSHNQSNEDDYRHSVAGSHMSLHQSSTSVRSSNTVDRSSNDNHVFSASLHRQQSTSQQSASQLSLIGSLFDAVKKELRPVKVNDISHSKQQPNSPTNPTQEEDDEDDGLRAAMMDKSVDSDDDGDSMFISSSQYRSRHQHSQLYHSAIGGELVNSTSNDTNSLCISSHSSSLYHPQRTSTTTTTTTTNSLLSLHTPQTQSIHPPQLDINTAPQSPRVGPQRQLQLVVQGGNLDNNNDNILNKTQPFDVISSPPVITPQLLHNKNAAPLADSVMIANSAVLSNKSRELKLLQGNLCHLEDLFGLLLSKFEAFTGNNRVIRHSLVDLGTKIGDSGPSSTSSSPTHQGGISSLGDSHGDANNPPSIPDTTPLFSKRYLLFVQKDFTL